MILKLKIYLVANFESREIANKVQKYLDSKYYDVVLFHEYDNYILDSMAVSNIINNNIKNNIAFMFCNNASNLVFATQATPGVKNIIIDKCENLYESLFLNANILTFSEKNFDETKILKIIDYYLELFEQGDKLFY